MAERVTLYRQEDLDNVWASAYAQAFHMWTKTMPNTPENRVTCAKLAIKAAREAVDALKMVVNDDPTARLHEETTHG